MVSVGVSSQVVLNLEEGSKKNARIEVQVDTVRVETEGTLAALPTTGLTWIPVVEQVLEFEVVDKAGNKAGKMKARARAKAKEKPTTKSHVETAAPTPPPPRKSQRARQPPAKFRYLVPRPLGQQALPLMAPNFVHPPSSNGISPLPLPLNLMVPFPPIPVSTQPGGTSLLPPAPAAAPLHLSGIPSINGESLQPGSSSAATPTLVVPRARPASVERRRSAVANKRSAVREKLPRTPSPGHTGLSQSSASYSQGENVEGVVAPSLVEASASTKTAMRSVGSSALSTGSSKVCMLRVSAGSPWPNCVQTTRSCFRPYVSSSSDEAPSPAVGTGAAPTVERHPARKPPLPPNSWYRKFVRLNPPYPPPAILKRSFFHVPPPPSHESHPMVPPRASLNNRDLRFPKLAICPSSALPGKLQVAQTSSSLQSVPWVVLPDRDGNQRRFLDSNFSGHSDGMNIPGQTRSQQKRRMRQLKNGIGKKFQNLMQGAKLFQEPEGQHQGVSTVKQIVITDEQRTKLVNDMIEACRSDPKFRARYLDAVKQLSYFGVLQTASYQLIAQGPSQAAQEVVNAWKNQPPPTNDGSTSASIKFYRAVNKVHEGGVEAMEKLPSLKEAGSCSLTKRNDGAWVFTLPDEKKRKLNCEERSPTNAS